MKIESISLKNFKRFDQISIDIKNNALNEVASQFLILGDNGSGKTTILQAVALCLSLVSRRIRSIDDLDWLGWMPGRYRRWGTPQIEMVVRFTDDEIEATREAASRCDRAGYLGEGKPFVPPPRTNVVRLGMDGERYWVGDPQHDSHPPEIYLFRGRSYAASLLRHDPSARELFEALPGVFWFDQFRNLATPPGSRQVESGDNQREERADQISYGVGVSRLRQYLNSWKLYKLQNAARPGQIDYLMELENHYKRIFPGRSFADLEPMYRGGVPSPSDYYFMLSDGNRTYDIEEMSSGEQAVFPMLYEFVRQRINSSIVLIDEIDLNLHPPLAQSLLSSLPRLGPRCQFILTTHSGSITTVVSPHEVHRLEGGRPCL